MKLCNEKEFIEFNVGKTFYENDLSETSFELIVKAQVSFMNISFSTYSLLYNIKEFYKKLKYCYDKVKGTAEIKAFSYEDDISLKVTFLSGGHAEVEANIKSNNQYGNKCTLRFNTDQTFINLFLREMNNELEALL